MPTGEISQSKDLILWAELYKAGHHNAVWRSRDILAGAGAGLKVRLPAPAEMKLIKGELKNNFLIIKEVVLTRWVGCC